MAVWELKVSHKYANPLTAGPEQGEPDYFFHHVRADSPEEAVSKTQERHGPLAVIVGEPVKRRALTEREFSDALLASGMPLKDIDAMVAKRRAILAKDDKPSLVTRIKRAVTKKGK